jgi:hypothetical protein
MTYTTRTASPLIASALVVAACATSPIIKPTELLGEYTTVSESSCNVTLSLLPSRAARITDACRVEDGSGRDVKKEMTATWAADENRIVIRYGENTDELEFAEMLPYSPFGRRGAGPGLRVIRISGSGSAFGGYEALWKSPIGTNKR